MKKYFVVLLAIVLFAFYSCQKFAGTPITKEFNIEGSYTELQVENAFDVTVDSTATQISVTVGENIMPKVVVEVVNSTLKIHLKGFNHSNYGSDMKVILPYNAALTSVDLSGASEFRSEYGVHGEEIEIDLSGASDFYCDIEADEIEMDLSGSSNIIGFVTATQLDINLSGASDATLEGEVETLKIDLTGASNIVKKIVGNRYALVCDQCEGSVSGASDVYIHCDGSIIVSLSGSSDLHYTGQASTSGSNTTGASSIIHDVL